MKKLLVVFIIGILGFGLIFIACDDNNDNGGGGGSSCPKGFCIFSGPLKELSTCGKYSCNAYRKAQETYGWGDKTYYCDCP